MQNNERGAEMLPFFINIDMVYLWIFVAIIFAIIIGLCVFIITRKHKGEDVDEPVVYEGRFVSDEEYAEMMEENKRKSSAYNIDMSEIISAMENFKKLYEEIK